MIKKRRDIEQPYTEKEITYILKTICEGLCDLKKAGICHRDIKSANLILNSKGTKFLITDFGISK